MRQTRKTLWYEGAQMESAIENRSSGAYGQHRYALPGSRLANRVRMSGLPNCAIDEPRVLNRIIDNTSGGNVHSILFREI